MENPEGYVTVTKFQRGEILRGNGRLIVLGTPKPDDESHNCDAMGCGQWHVVHVEFLAAEARIAELRALLSEAVAFVDIVIVPCAQFDDAHPSAAAAFDRSDDEDPHSDWRRFSSGVRDRITAALEKTP